MRLADACAELEVVLVGPFRREVVAHLARAADLRAALGRLREAFRTNTLAAGTRRVRLDAMVREQDRRARAEGLHVLHDWDGRAGRINPDTIPIEVLDYLHARCAGEAVDARAVGILLDYYLLYLLALLSTRIFDDDDADAGLDRLQRLVEALQSGDGSGQPFVSDAETLLLVATSHYEVDEGSYDRLLERVRRLDAAHQARVGIGHAAALGCHLRFGFEATYRRDIGLLRADNAADYPWLAFALRTTIDAWRRARAAGDEVGSRRTIEALFGGLTADAGSFVAADTPSWLATADGDRREFRAAFFDGSDELLAAFETLRPTAAVYSPLALFFNFSQNVIKGVVVDALLWGDTRAVVLNDLFASGADAGASASRLAAAQALNAYAQAHPSLIRRVPTPVIVYDPVAGRRACGRALGELRTATGPRAAP